jgi:D-3-phosphoglycerate dehydrogenase
MSRIVVSDPLQQSGIDELRKAGAEVVELEDRDRLIEVIADFDALIVRSSTKVTSEILEAGTRLKVVGRAGIGVDNVDVARATELGILVVNAPTANMLSATEHTFALLLSLARRVAAADADLKKGQWNRKEFVGQELSGKTLGIVGLGQIGSRVASRAQAFEMKVLAFDPFLSAQAARRLGVELSDLDDMIPRVDALTFHTPLTDETRGLLNRERMARMRKGAFVINCGRGGVIDEEALLEALESGQIGGAGLDVFAQEPPASFDLIQHPKVVATPHIGAQTREAQERIGSQIAEMVLGALAGSLEVAAVNLPFRPAGGTSGPFLELGEQLGKLGSFLLDGGLQEIQIDLWGVDDDLEVPLSVATIKGALTPFLGEKVNFVNAEGLAATRGVEVVRSSHTRGADFSHLIGVTLKGEGGEIEVAGTLYGESDPRVVRIHGFRLEFKPQGRLLILRNEDVPGVVGMLGTMLGEAGINIADIHLSRDERTTDAMAVLRLDAEPGSDLLESLRSAPQVKEAWSLEL